MQDFIRGLRINMDEAGKNNYYRRIPAIHNLDTLDFNKNISFFVGENGTGKSTLLEAIAVCFGLMRKGEALTFNFPPRIPIQIYITM